MKILPCKKPKGYISTQLYFNSEIQVEEYVKNLNKSFLNNKHNLLNFPLSKRKEKIVINSQPKKHILTREGSKLLLWKKLK